MDSKDEEESPSVESPDGDLGHENVKLVNGYGAEESIEVTAGNEEMGHKKESRLSKFRANPNTALGIVTFAFFVDYLLLLLCVPILPLIGVTLGLSKFQIGLLFTTKAIMQILCNPLMGWVSDKVGRRAPMVTGLIVLGASTVLFAFGNSFAVLFFARIMQGIASSANVTAGFALLADCFPDSKERGKKMPIAISGLSCGVLLGAPLGGLLYQIGGARLPFFAVAGFIFIDGIARALLLVEPPRAQKAPSTEKATVKKIFMSYIRILIDLEVSLIALGLLLGDGMISLMEVILPLYLSEELGFSPFLIGIIYGINPLIYAICVPLFGQVNARLGTKIGGRWTLIFVSICSMGLGAIMLLLIKNNVWLIFSWCIVGIGMAGVDGCSNPELADIGDRRFPDSYGRIYAVGNTASGCGFIVGPLIGTALVTSSGFFSTFFITGIVLIAFAPFLFARKCVKLPTLQTKEGDTDMVQLNEKTGEYETSIELP